MIIFVESFQRSLYRHHKKDGNPLAWSGQHLHLKEVRAFFAWLTKQNHLPFNPAAEIDLPKQPKTLPKAILSADEVERILAEPNINTALGLRDRAILETFYSTGHTLSASDSRTRRTREDGHHADLHPNESPQAVGGAWCYAPSRATRGTTGGVTLTNCSTWATLITSSGHSLRGINHGNRN